MIADSESRGKEAIVMRGRGSPVQDCRLSLILKHSDAPMPHGADLILKLLCLGVTASLPQVAKGIVKYCAF